MNDNNITTKNGWSKWAELTAPYLNSSDQRIKNATEKFGESLRTAHEGLWLGQHGLSLTERETDVVLEHLEQKKPRAIRRLIQHIFRQGLSCGNINEQWACYLPPMRRRIRHAMPLVRQADFARVQPLRLAQAALNKRLDSLDLSDPAVSAGAVIFCAAGYSGLIAKRWLHSLCTATDDDLTISSPGLRLDLKDLNNAKKRRSFFPDQFTELLILSHRDRHGLPIIKLQEGSGVAKAMENCLEAFGDTLELDKDTSRDLKKNLHLISLPALFQNAPGYIVGSSIDRTPTTHLRNDTLARIFNETFSPQAALTPSPEVGINLRPMNIPPKVVDGRRDSYLRGILRILATFGQPQMTLTSQDAILEVSNLRPSDCELWPVEKLLRDWAFHLLNEAGRGAAAPSSVARYFQAVWQPLLVSAQDIELLPLDAASWEDLYDEVLALVHSEAGRRYLQGRLHSFHQWMAKENEAPAVDFRELDNYATGTGTVNANLITVTEFKTAIARLDDPEMIADEWLREVCINVLTLCFRCGLRRREPLQLRLMDFRQTSSVLWIRPSQYGSVKSTQGIRKLFLDALLEPEELQRFEHWFAKVTMGVARPGTSDNLIFCNPEQPQQMVDAQRVFGKIMDIVRQVCNDVTLVPHHLRHSFANWTFVRLQIATGSLAVQRTTPAFADVSFDLASCRLLKERLYNFLPDQLVDAGRRDLYCVTALMGHLSPSTTMRSYIHLIDFLTGCFMRDYPKLTRVDDIANLRGVDRSRIYQMVKAAANPDADVFMLVLGDLRRRLIQEKASGEKKRSDITPQIAEINSAGG